MEQDKFILTGLEIFGRHGCSTEEQTLGQKFKVDAEIFFDLSKSGKSDDMADTIDYTKILATIKKIVEGEPRKLIETVAEEIAENLLNEFSKIDAVKIVLHKPFAPIDFILSDVAVSITRKRN